MKCEPISKRSLPVLVVLGLALAIVADAFSAPPGRVPISRSGAPSRAAPAAKPAAKTMPKPNVTSQLTAVPRRYPRAGVRAVPRGAAPVVVPGYRPRPVVRAGAAAVIVGSAPVVTQAAPSVVVTQSDSVAAPAEEPTPALTQGPTQAKAYRVISLADDFTLTVSIDGRQTPVRLLGVDPLLVAAAEGQPGVMPQDALQFVRNLLIGEGVYLEQDSTVAETDAEGIRVAYVHRAPDGLLVNLEIIRQGYGLAADGYSFQHRETFAAYQARAQQIGKGIWQGLQGARPQN